MTILIEWGVVAVALALLSAGAGLGAERIAGGRLPPALLLPVGFAALIVLTQLAAFAGLAAGLAAALLATSAAAGAASALWPAAGRARWHGSWARARWPLGAVGVTWLFYAGVVALTGQQTFGGYTQLADTAIHLVGAETLPGRPDPAALPPSSFAALYDVYYHLTGYPHGGASLLGTLDVLLGRGPVETIQPLLAFALAMLTASAWVMLAATVPTRPQRALISVLVALPVLTVAFALQGSLKEVLAIACLAVGCAAWPTRLPEGSWTLTVRAVVPAALAASALLATIGSAAGVYLLPAALLGLLVAAHGGNVRRLGVAGGALIALVVALSLPVVLQFADYSDAAGAVLTAQAERGNLAADRQPAAQLLGVWLGPDFRMAPSLPRATDVAALAIALLVLLGTLALVGDLRSRARRVPAGGLIIWLGATLAGTVVVVAAGSPWADAKGLAIAGPAVIAAAGVGASWLSGRRRLAPLAGILAAVATAGVLGSATYAARNVAPAPQTRFDELAAVGDRWAGKGPMLVAEFEEFTRYLLHEVPATFLVDPFAPVPGAFPNQLTTDLDGVDQAALRNFPLVLLRSGPQASRPPSDYRRVWRGSSYELWQRDDGAPVPRAHLAVGQIADGQPAGLPECADVRALAAQAEPGDRVIVAERAASPVISLTLPVGWQQLRDGRVQPRGAGTVRGSWADAGGRPVELWLEGSFTRPLEVNAGGVTTTVPAALGLSGAWTRIASTRTNAAGLLEYAVRRPGNLVAPGAGDVREWWGSMRVSDPDPTGSVQLRSMTPAQASRSCAGLRDAAHGAAPGRAAIDWIELVPGR